MFEFFMELAIFSAKAVILVGLVLFLIASIFSLAARGKEKNGGKITIKNLNEAYRETKQRLLETILPKKAFKHFLKEQSVAEKAKQKTLASHTQKNLYVIDFAGDIKASAVEALREEVTAIIHIATPHDQVLVRLESAGGMVHAYGLAAAQLARLRQHNIPLIVSVDKVAASGGYMMAAVANKIIAAPFSIIGSIGVIVQLPNFHRLLKDKHIDFEQVTAGNYKRTLTVFGENTKEGREKLHQEIEEIHDLFKKLIQEYRQDINIDAVSTGEHWLAKQAIQFKLVDELMTSDDYLLSQLKDYQLFEIKFHLKKSLSEKLFQHANMKKNLLTDALIDTVPR